MLTRRQQIRALLDIGKRTIALAADLDAMVSVTPFTKDVECAMVDILQDLDLIEERTKNEGRHHAP
jgi:hypothetical protein